MHSALISELQRVAQAKATGLFFLASNSNRSAQISFAEGVMVFALCQGKKGIGALELIAQMEEVRLRFQEGSIPSARTEMPPFEEVIALLSGSKGQGGAVGKGVASPGKPSQTQPVPATGAELLSSTQKQLIRDVLTECIGPMAM